MSGRGHHFVWQISQTSEAFRQLRDLGRIQPSLEQRYSTVTWEEAAQAFIAAFSETLDLHLEPGELSPAEVARAEELVQEKYAHPIWTERI